MAAESGETELQAHVEDPVSDGVGDDESGEEELNDAAAKTDEAAIASKPKKKRKSAKAKLKKALGRGSDDAGEGSSSKPASKLTSRGVEELLEANPSLKAEIAGMSQEKAVEALRKLDVADLMTGVSISGKNQKDMASYKFWQTQPVPRFDDTKDALDGPIKVIDPDKVPKEPRTLYEGFEWVTLDVTNEEELRELYELLTGHYVEDSEAQFRLTYRSSFLNWGLKSPGWYKEWHVGVRAIKSKKLVAFISAVPVNIRVRENVVKCAEVNFLCVHKKLRSKRLAPVLIEEVTRRCYLVGVFQAIYTAATVLPKPVSSCRYYHRPLDWLKLYEVGFAGLPSGSTKARQVAKNQIPSSTTIQGLRLMERKDVKAVFDLLNGYLKRFQFAPEYTEEEVEHWFVYDAAAANSEGSQKEQVIWTYVVEDPQSHKVTDFSSFFCLESSVIGNPRHECVRAAYSFYYGSEIAMSGKEDAWRERLNALMLDTLVLAKKANFDVFNALTLLDNPFFLNQQKFGKGDGQLYYYLFNYRTPMVVGGVNAKNESDEGKRGGVGMVLL